MAGTFKLLGVGMQPASQTPVSTELSILGTDERITIPCVTSTKVLEIKEMLAQRLGIEPQTMHFVTKQGPLCRRQHDHEEIRRRIVITGIPSFTRVKQKYDEPFVIIGAGHVGLRHGLWFLKYGVQNFMIIDRRNRVGGTSWIAQANKTSKLQTEIGTYHLQYDDGNPVPTNLPTWPSRDQLLMHFAEVSQEHGLMPYIRLSTTVTSVDLLGSGNTMQGPLRIAIEKTDGKYEGVMSPVATGEGQEEINCAAIFMYPGNLSYPREELYKGEELFGGHIVYAMHDSFDYSQVKGKNVAIIGHGAFAVENVRTCCEYSSGRIYMVCRRKNLACPRVTSWLVNQSDPFISGALFLKSAEHMYKLTPWDPWSYHSVHTNEARSRATIEQKARFGIGDVYFLAVYMQKCEVVEDKVKRLTEGAVHLDSGRKLQATVILKLLGFTGDFEVDRLLRIREMTGFWANGDSRRYCASEGPGVSAANFGGTSLSPGALVWVDQGTHMVEYPKDWKTLLNSCMLPVHKAEQDIGKPAYVLDARLQSSMGLVIPSFCPQIGERSVFYGALKRRKQLECHPMQTFLDEAAAEWDEYGKKWKAEDPSLLDPPPFPYTEKVVQELLEQAEGERAK